MGLGLGGEAFFKNVVTFGKPFLDIPNLKECMSDDITLQVLVNSRGIWLHRLLWVKNRRKRFVINLD